MACVDDYRTIKAHMNGTFSFIDAKCWHNTNNNTLYVHLLTDDVRIYFDNHFRAYYSKRFSMCHFPYQKNSNLIETIRVWNCDIPNIKFEIVKDEMDL